MVNAVKGEVGFKAGDAEYTLVFDFNAICALEDEFNVEAGKIGEIVGARASNIRRVFRIGLGRNHPGLKDIEVGDIITAITPAHAGELITEAFRRAFPEVAKGRARPQKASGNGNS